MRVVVDTNVIVSALLFRGVASGFRERWRAGSVRLVASREIIAEYARVLAYPKFRLSAEVANGLLAVEVLPFSDIVQVPTGEALCRDPDDDKFIWAAIASGAEGIVTGDPDLLALRPDVKGIPMFTIPEMLKRVPHASALPPRE